MLPPTDVQGARVYPWLLTKGPDSKEMQEAEVKLFTAIAGTPFVSKLGQKRAAATGTKPTKVKAAAIEDEQDNKKQTAKSKAKSKSEGKVRQEESTGRR